MRLPQEDIKLFLKLHSSYLFFVNKKLRLLKKVETIDNFLELPFHQKNNIRNAARENPELLSVFVKENPFKFNKVDLAIISSWQYALDTSFYILRYNLEHAIFLDTQTTPRAYGVTCLKNEFTEILGDKLPVYVKTVLLPFKNTIIYDGFIFTYPITFDRPIVQELEADLENWLTRYGLITQLPDIGENQKENSEDMLRYYLKSQQYREIYTREITKIIDENPNLQKLYFELSGKLDARDARKFFRDIGIRDVWCAVLRGKILATGKSRETVIETLNVILPKDRKLYPFIFHYKEGGKIYN